MTSEHTPGPWTAYRDDDRAEYEIGVKRGRLGTRVVALVEFGFIEPTEAEQHANARLIAAAPDLLALAKQYASECSGCDGKGTWMGPDLHTEPCQDCADIRAVINKAEGRV